jgi:aldehyde:ferredoxin oxidoreductase
MAQYGGWTGATLRVDLSTRIITKEDTMKYKDYIGGLGLGLKVLWDEVPPGVKAFDAANRIIFAVGPLTGTGTPLSGRVTITSLWPNHPDELPASGHMGGHWGPELKYAGYDAIIIQGKAAKPSWLYINDGIVEIRDAGNMWGNGIYRVTSDIQDIMGPSCHVAAIGQCGETMGRLANIMTGRSHSAGGLGGVMGSKNLKAIGVLGTGAVKIAADKVKWKALVKYQHTILGANSGGVVPNVFQSWQPDGYYGGTRWTADKGIYWGAARPPVDTGVCAADDMNSIGLRTHKGYADFGPGVGDKHTVKIGGCHGCPIRCHIYTDVPALENYGVSRYQVNTCNGNSVASGMLFNTPRRSEANILASQLSVAVSDDYGLWSDYGLFQPVFQYMYTYVIPVGGDTWNPPNSNPKLNLWKKYCPTDYARLETFVGSGGITNFWKKLNPNHPAAVGTAISDPSFVQDFVPMIAANKMRDGSLATWEKISAPGGVDKATIGAIVAQGVGRMMALFPELNYAVTENLDHKFNHLNKGFIKHHFTESTGMGQTSALINMMFNRDPQCHTHTNFQGNGLPKALQNEIFKELFAADGVSGDPLYPGTAITPMNKSKAVFAKLSLIYLELHNSLTICNYTLPGWASPLKSRNYRGDADMDAKYYSAVTGENVTRAHLEDMGIRILCLARALNARYMNTKNQRNLHDIIPEWAFHAYAGTSTLDHADMEIAKDMLYEEFGWDKATGMPTRATFERLGMKAVADELAGKGLLP